MASINTVMPRVSRHIIDKALTGHACTTRIGVKASQRQVYANGRPILRPGDRLLPHTILVPGTPPRCVGHPAKVKKGSPNVFAANRPIARKRDSADKGVMLQGSPNVFANGN